MTLPEVSADILALPKDDERRRVRVMVLAALTYIAKAYVGQPLEYTDLEQDVAILSRRQAFTEEMAKEGFEVNVRMNFENVRGKSQPPTWVVTLTKK